MRRTAARAAGSVEVGVRWPERSAEAGASRYLPPYAESLVLELYPKGSEADEAAKRRLTLNRPDGTAASAQTARFDGDFEVGVYVLVGRAQTGRDGGGATVARAQTEFEVRFNETATPRLTLASTLQAVQIQGEPLAIRVGDTLTLTGTATDADGAALLLPPGALTFQQVSGEAAGQVTADGVFTAKSAGVARVRLIEPQLQTADEADITVRGRTGLADSAWPKFGADKKNTGRSRKAVPVAAGVKVWETSLGSAYRPIRSGPLVGENNEIFVGTFTGVVVLDAASGKVLRQREIGPVNEIILTQDGLLYAEVVTQFDYVGEYFPYPPQEMSDIITLNSTTLADVDRSTLWAKPGMALKDDGRLLVYSRASPPALDDEENPHYTSTTAVVVVGDGLHYSYLRGAYSGDEGVLRAYKIKPSDLVWEQRIFRNNGGHFRSSFGLGPALLADNTVIFTAYVFQEPRSSSGGGKVGAVDGRTGAVKWINNLKYGPGPNLAIADGVIYVTTYGGLLYAINGDTGSFRWSLHYSPGGLEGAGTVAITNDGAVVCAVSNTLFCIR